MLTAKGKNTLRGVQPVKVCGSLEARELKQPGRTVYRPGLQVQSNTPIILYYVAYAGLLHALFFCADHVPEVAAIVNWQGSAVIAALTIIVMIAGTPPNTLPLSYRSEPPVWLVGYLGSLGGLLVVPDLEVAYHGCLHVAPRRVAGCLRFRQKIKNTIKNGSVKSRRF
jgi:hypothetical protein